MINNILYMIIKNNVIIIKNIIVNDSYNKRI